MLIVILAVGKVHFFLIMQEHTQCEDLPADCWSQAQLWKDKCEQSGAACGESDEYIIVYFLDRNYRYKPVIII